MDYRSMISLGTVSLRFDGEVNYIKSYGRHMGASGSCLHITWLSSIMGAVDVTAYIMCAVNNNNNLPK